MKNPEFGRRLKKLREDMTFREGVKVTQEVVGKAIGLADRYYQRLEAGHVPKGETVGKLGKYFQCSVDWLLYGSGAPPLNIDTPKKEEIEYRPAEVARDYSEKYDAAGVDEYYRASGQLKAIFDSHDPTFIQAISANLKAFSRAINQSQENQELRNKIKFKSLEERIAALELRIQKGGAVSQRNIGDIASDITTGHATARKAK